MKLYKKLFIGFSLSFYMLLAFQNCAKSPSSFPGITEVDPDLGPKEFLSKISSDAQYLVSSKGPETEKTCKLVLPDCSNSLHSLDSSCLKESIDAYYQSLECAGFEVTTGDSCILAVSNSKPRALEPVLVDLTCVNDSEPPNKSLHLNVCHGEEIGFDPDKPSTGMRISSWVELGKTYPFSRSAREVAFYPSQKSVNLQLFEESASNKMVDACGKTQARSPLGLNLEIQVKELNP